jgi:cellulose synthase/poly-beta-1,6-N-acetylglucosamine synthase-like glycosyltransferase
MKPIVTIIVTACNEGPVIADCLRSLARQKYAGNYGIVLVDDRSRDDTSEVARALDLENFTLLRLESFDHPALTARQVALDRAIQTADGEWIFLTDADAVVRHDWLARMLEYKHADAIAGPVVFLPHPEGGSRWIARLQTVDSAFYTGFCAVLNACGVTSGFVFGNCAFRRECYLKTGGFESIGFALTEDLAFARALRNTGYRLAFTAYPGVSVRACRSWSALLRRAQRIGSGGVSMLALAISVWMLGWLGLGLGALVHPAGFALLFLIRHLLGAFFTAWWLARGGRFRLLPLALIYEPCAILIGLAVLGHGRSSRTVEWGDLNYPR